MAAILKMRTFFLWFLSLGVALVSYRFVFLGLEGAFPDPEMLAHIANQKLAFILHVSASPLALITGLFQFLPGLRARRPGLHCWTGRLYVLAVLVGGLSSLVMVIAMDMLDRPSAVAGLGLLAILWLALTANALRLAMAGRVAEHRRWMLRSYALSFAAVTLRLELPFFFIFTDMDYAAITSYVGWLSWVPNLLFAEWWLNRRRTRRAAGSPRRHPRAKQQKIPASNAA